MKRRAKPQPIERVLGVLTLRDTGSYNPARVAQLAAWLRAQAEFLERETEKLAATYRARFLVSGKD